MKKAFKLQAFEIKELATGYGGCIATDMITVDGHKVGFMFRDEPRNEMDSGWQFVSGHESDEYMSNAAHHEIYDVNTIANYDPDIIKFLDAPIGSEYGRNEAGELVEITD